MRCRRPSRFSRSSPISEKVAAIVLNKRDLLLPIWIQHRNEGHGLAIPGSSAWWLRPIHESTGPACVPGRLIQELAGVYGSDKPPLHLDPAPDVAQAGVAGGGPQRGPLPRLRLLATRRHTAAVPLVSRIEVAELAGIGDWCRGVPSGGGHSAHAQRLGKISWMARIHDRGRASGEGCRSAAVWAPQALPGGLAAHAASPRWPGVRTATGLPL